MDFGAAGDSYNELTNDLGAIQRQDVRLASNSHDRPIPQPGEQQKVENEYQ